MHPTPDIDALADAVAADPALVAKLPAEDVRRLGAELRDRFFEVASAGADDGRRVAFRRWVDAVDVPSVATVEGLAVSFHPTRRFKQVRLVEARLLDEELRPLFARPSRELHDHLAVFVDPEELSFRTFENILPLDRWFSQTALSLRLEGRQKLGGERGPVGYQLRLEGTPETLETLRGLDDLGLYGPPLNAGSRGGRRFIFHSADLAAALTVAVEQALPKTWRKGFSHVNPVFRCNRFEPGDAPFRRHVDTPYHDAARHHVSKLTLLLYLTGGRGEGAVRLGDVALDALEPMSCVVFPQDLVHEGAAFDHGPKVFLRTELVFVDRTLRYEPTIAATFAKACYLTGESAFAPELAEREHALYDRAAAAHFGGGAAVEPDTWFHKRFRGVAFATNGYDFWFSDAVPLATCAALALLDVLNGKVGGEAFRKQCSSAVVERSGPPSTWLSDLVAAPVECTEPPVGQLALDLLFPPPDAPDEEVCCPFHRFESFIPERNPDTHDFFGRAQRWARARLKGAPITLLGEEVFLDPDKFVVEAGKIHVLSERALAPVNFAACWNDDTRPPNYVDVEATVEAPTLLVPPILFEERPGLRHLMFDLFRNGWWVEATPRAVPVPKVRTLTETDFDSGAWEETPWLTAAASDDARAPGEERDGVWWADEDSPVLGELYRDE